jgi:hypothetical protein
MLDSITTLPCKSEKRSPCGLFEYYKHDMNICTDLAKEFETNLQQYVKTLE